MIVLAVETSCDESSVAVVADGELRSLCTVTQSVHRNFGGVVPELAGRTHLQLVDLLTSRALAEASLRRSEVDLVAATVGPGLIGSLLVGSSYARGLSLALGKPFRGVHHVEAHLWSAEIGFGPLLLPFLVLLVSGGHTLIIMVEGIRKYRVLGTTLDDALGEAYDKVGKLFGCTFPAGAQVDQLAAQGRPDHIKLAPPLMDQSYDVSFSGLKTAVLYLTRNPSGDDSIATSADILAAFQEAALQSVVHKVRHAALVYTPRAIVSAGGVAANSRLRQLLGSLARDFAIPFACPAAALCQDNAAMIGYLAWKLETAGIRHLASVTRPRWPLQDLADQTLVP